jgi:hypothetical protein
MIRSRSDQRALGVLMLLASLAIMVYAWSYAQERGHVFVLWLIALPAFAVLSLGLVFFPMDVERLQREHGVDRVQSWEQLPTAWRVLLVFAAVAALTNHFLVTGRLL